MTKYLLGLCGILIVAVYFLAYDSGKKSVAIQAIPYDKERTKALNAWHNPTMFSRADPYIDMIGAFFNLTPDDIDILWVANNE